jgi:hypothetical protein
MVEIHKKEYELIIEILENFDFDKCEKVMKHLNWTWWNNSNSPTVQELRESAKQRIEDSIINLKKEEKWHYSQPYMSSSGGVCAHVWKNRYGKICNIQLQFILTEWDTF